MPYTVYFYQKGERVRGVRTKGWQVAYTANTKKQAEEWLNENRPDRDTSTKIEQSTTRPRNQYVEWDEGSKRERQQRILAEKAIKKDEEAIKKGEMYQESLAERQAIQRTFKGGKAYLAKKEIAKKTVSGKKLTPKEKDILDIEDTGLERTKEKARRQVQQNILSKLKFESVAEARAAGYEAQVLPTEMETETVKPITREDVRTSLFQKQGYDVEIRGQDIYAEKNIIPSQLYKPTTTGEQIIVKPSGETIKVTGRVNPSLHFQPTFYSQLGTGKMKTGLDYLTFKAKKDYGIVESKAAKLTTSLLPSYEKAKSLQMTYFPQSAIGETLLPKPAKEFVLETQRGGYEYVRQKPMTAVTIAGSGILFKGGAILASKGGKLAQGLFKAQALGLTTGYVAYTGYKVGKAKTPSEKGIIVGESLVEVGSFSAGYGTPRMIKTGYTTTKKTTFNFKYGKWQRTLPTYEKYTYKQEPFVTEIPGVKNRGVGYKITGVTKSAETYIKAQPQNIRLYKQYPDKLFYSKVPKSSAAYIQKSKSPKYKADIVIAESTYKDKSLYNIALKHEAIHYQYGDIYRFPRTKGETARIEARTQYLTEDVNYKFEVDLLEVRYKNLVPTFKEQLVQYDLYGKPLTKSRMRFLKQPLERTDQFSDEALYRIRYLEYTKGTRTMFDQPREQQTLKGISRQFVYTEPMQRIDVKPLRQTKVTEPFKTDYVPTEKTIQPLFKSRMLRSKRASLTLERQQEIVREDYFGRSELLKPRAEIKGPSRSLGPRVSPTFEPTYFPITSSIVGSKTTPLSSTSVRKMSISSTALITRPVDDIGINIKPRSYVTPISITSPKQDVRQETMAITILDIPTVPRPTTPQRPRPPRPTDPVPTPEITGGGGIDLPKGKPNNILSGKTSKSILNFSPKYVSQPYAVAFNIFGKRPKTLTGVTVRPLIKL